MARERAMATRCWLLVTGYWKKKSLAQRRRLRRLSLFFHS
jgi:hypothetical protein